MYEVENLVQFRAKMTKLFSFIDVALIYTGYILDVAMKRKSKSEIRAYIKSRTALHISPKEVFNELVTIHGTGAVSFKTVCRWAKKFKDGFSLMEDGHRSGRPKTSLTDKHVAAVKALVEEDGRFSVKDIARSVGISEGSVHSILTKDLGLKKVCARWVPHLLTSDQKRLRVTCSKKLLKQFKRLDSRVISNMLTGDETWVYMFEPQRRGDNKQWRGKHQKRPVVAKRIKSTKKILYTIFFNHLGPVVQIPSETGKSITGTYYKNVVLKKVKKFYELKRPSTGLRGINLLHDNAPAHKSKVVVEYLEEEKVNVLDHPPYSPDLSPCDFFLFPRLKKMLSGRRFNTRSALGSAVYQCLRLIPRADYSDAFRQWKVRLQKCISAGGEYFEGMQ